MLLKSAFTAVLAATSAASALSIAKPQAGLEQRSWDDTPTTFVHVVLFNLKADLSEAQKQEFCSSLLGLKDKTILPSTGQHYIVESTGGADNSPEGAEHGYTHGFVSKFANKADRDYFVLQDPNHDAWKAAHRPEWNDVLVLDYQEFVY